MRWSQVFAAVSLSAATIASLASCTLTQETDDVASGVVMESATLSVQPDINSWAMPLDSYLWSPIDSLNEKRVIDLSLQKCLAPGGYEWVVAPREPADLLLPGQDAAGRTIRNSKSAQLWGYLPEQSVQGGEYIELQRAQEEMSTEITSSPEGRALWDSCFDQALDLIGDADPLELQYGNLISGVDDEGLEAEVNAWLDCVDGVGIDPSIRRPKDIPGSPWMIALAEKRVPDKDGVLHPSDDEIRIASADYRCRDTSGYTQRLYDSQWQQQLEALNNPENQAGLMKAVEIGRERRELINAFLENTEH